MVLGRANLRLHVRVLVVWYLLDLVDSQPWEFAPLVVCVGLRIFQVAELERIPAWEVPSMIAFAPTHVLVDERKDVVRSVDDVLQAVEGFTQEQRDRLGFAAGSHPSLV